MSSFFPCLISMKDFWNSVQLFRNRVSKGISFWKPSKKRRILIAFFSVVDNSIFSDPASQGEAEELEGEVKGSFLRKEYFSTKEGKVRNVSDTAPYQQIEKSLQEGKFYFYNFSNDSFRDIFW